MIYIFIGGDIIKKYVRPLFPFFIYCLCIIIIYFVIFYLFPKYTEVIKFFGLIFTFLYVYVGVFVFGFIMGKITIYRSSICSNVSLLLYALIASILMLFVGSLELLFTQWTIHISFSLSLLKYSLLGFDSIFISIATFISFLIGECTVYLSSKHKQEPRE